jgi:hypothetical protein
LVEPVVSAAAEELAARVALAEPEAQADRGVSVASVALAEQASPAVPAALVVSEAPAELVESAVPAELVESAVPIGRRSSRVGARSEAATAEMETG